MVQNVVEVFENVLYNGDVFSVLYLAFNFGIPRIVVPEDPDLVTVDIEDPVEDINQGRNVYRDHVIGVAPVRVKDKEKNEADRNDYPPAKIIHDRHRDPERAPVPFINVPRLGDEGLNVVVVPNEGVCGIH